MSKKKKQMDLSPYESREPLCPHFGACGGCIYQKISYDNQLKMKAEKVRDLLESVSGSFEFESILPSPSEEGYRNKMEFTFGDECKDGPFALGLHQKGSFMNIVNIMDCHLVHDDMNKIRNEARDFFNEYYEKGEVDFKNNKTHVGWLRHLLIRRAAATGEILVALVTASPAFSSVEKLKDETVAGKLVDGFKNRILGLTLEGKVAGILHITNDALSDVVKSDKTDILFGNDYINEEVLGLKFKISTFSFFQTNTKGAEVLYGKAREYAAKAHGLLFDLYSGTGTIAQLMAPVVNKVIGVEIVAEAVEAAKENAALNGVENAEFVTADVLKALDDLPKPDSIILDPPREGIHPKALGKILSYKVENIVYVSCKPESLARDLQSFKIAGYDLVKACCVDMFPETEHVETVVLMSRVKP